MKSFTISEAMPRKRILAAVLMVLSVVLSILCIGGIVGTWTVNRSVKNNVVNILTGTEGALDVADGALGRIGTQVSTTRDRVADFEEAVQIAGENFAENPVIVAALSERLDLGIAPAINDLRETIQSIRETIIGIQNAIETLNALPFISIGEKVSDRTQLQQLSEGITALTEGIQETRNGIRRPWS